MAATRLQRLIAIGNVIGDCNPNIDLSLSIANGTSGELELFLTGKVEGRSLKLPFTMWKYSQKDGGTIIGVPLPVHYEKHWRYKIHNFS